MRAMEKLDSFMREAGLTNAAFAERVGVSEATISRVRNGKQEPSWNLIERIATATDGKVEPNDFLKVSTAPDLPKGAEAAE